MAFSVSFGLQSPAYPKQVTIGGDNQPIEFIDASDAKAGQNVALTLAGSDMPVEFALSMEQREEKTIYPGNSGATTQVMGMSYGDVNLDGEFDDLKGRQQNRAINMVSEIFRLMAKGKLYRIQWGEVVVLYARIRNFEPTWVRTGLCRWRLTLSVDHIENATAAQAAPFERPKIKKGAIALMILAELAEIANAARNMRNQRGLGFGFTSEEFDEFRGGGSPGDET